MKITRYYSIIGLLALASCKKDSPVNYAGSKTEALKTTAVCKTPPTFMGIRFAGGTGHDYGIRIIADAGGVIFYGGFSGTVDFDPGTGIANLTAPPSPNYGLFAQKFNKAGNFTGVSLVDVAATNDRNRYDRNGNSYRISFDDDNITDVNQIVAVYLTRLNAAGEQTAKIFLDSTKFENIFSGSIFIDNNRNVAYVTCAKRLYKFNHQGKLVWKKDINTTESATTVMCDKQGNIYVRMDYALIKYDSNGGLLWTKRLDAATRTMAFDPAGNIYMIGGFNRMIDFDPGPGTYYLTGQQYSETGPVVDDGYILKLDASGNFVWAVKPGTLGVTGIMIDPEGQYVYVSGTVRNTFSFYPITGKVTYTSKGEEDVFILAYKQCK